MKTYNAPIKNKFNQLTTIETIIQVCAVLSNGIFWCRKRLIWLWIILDRPAGEFSRTHTNAQEPHGGQGSEWYRSSSGAVCGMTRILP
ncbi:hypothetical protein EBU71_07965 [bacterium]|nr:hypothetical protein [Candidatus Elulimicrobium humile]